MTDWLKYLEGKLAPEILNRAAGAKAQKTGPAEFLFSQETVPAEVVLAAMSRHYRLPFIRLPAYHAEQESVSRIKEEVARRFLVLPLFRQDDRLYVALSNPEDLQAQDFLRQLTGLHIEPVLASPQDLEGAINRNYLTREKTAETMGAFEETTAAPTEEGKIRIEDEEAPAIKLVNYIFSQAINLKASDIHLESFAEKALLRYRVDGVLHEFPPPPLHLMKAIVSRIKIISNMDVAERRLPQDGRASFAVDGVPYDLRVSIIPNLHGEGVVIRILDTTGMKKSLEAIGMPPDVYSRYEKVITRPYGIVLLTGPTGSGKTSTLYATLKRIFTLQKKFITLEDPVEYQIEGITQLQVNAEIGFTFGAGLRSILRHDPDVIMLGEIRDLETAEIAIRSSLTGHLVFSTLHTNDAPSAVTRLMDMGVASYLVLSSLNGVMAQRLIRVLCPACKVRIPFGPKEQEMLGLTSLPDGAAIFGPAGCPACGNLGYKGRNAISELLVITPEMRRLSSSQLTPEILRDLALKDGFTTLRESALSKLFSGITSIEEVLSVTGEE
jgi:type IV pilus assembly protein PilB